MSLAVAYLTPGHTLVMGRLALTVGSGYTISQTLGRLYERKCGRFPARQHHPSQAVRRYKRTEHDEIIDEMIIAGANAPQ